MYFCGSKVWRVRMRMRMDKALQTLRKLRLKYVKHYVGLKCGVFSGYYRVADLETGNDVLLPLNMTNSV